MTKLHLNKNISIIQGRTIPSENNSLQSFPFKNWMKVFIQKIRKKKPLNRMLKKEKIRSTIQYLCTDASSYMTGQNIILDGGRSIL